MDNFNEEMKHLNPQFMGQQLGKVSIEQVRGLIKRQKRIRGYAFNCPIGSSEFNLDLSGTARILLGIGFLGTTGLSDSAQSWNAFSQVDSVQFTVNNEIVIDQLNPNFLTPYFNNNEYYYIPRPLSGTDQLTMKFINTGIATELVNMVLYYI